MPNTRPYTLPYLGTLPVLATPPLEAGPGSAVLGRVTVGRNARLGALSVMRADGHFVGGEALPVDLARDLKSFCGGRVINIASVHGLVASAQKSAYVAAKHGLVGLTKTVALETADTGITCNAICPGWVLTPLVDKQIRARAEGSGRSYAEAKLELVSEKQPAKEFVTPAQIGELALFLCSDAAALIRGQALAIDGGWTAQ